MSNAKITGDNIKLLSRKDIVRFALFCTKQTNYKDILEVEKCIEVIDLWLIDKASNRECQIAYDNVYNACDGDVICAVAYTAYAVYFPEDAVGHTVSASKYTIDAAISSAAKANTLNEQERYLYELININTIIEQTLLA